MLFLVCNTYLAVSSNMNNRNFLLIVVLLAVVAQLAGCYDKTAVNYSQNVFSEAIGKVEAFGYSEDKLRLLDSVFTIQKGANFKNKFYYYDYVCGYYHTYEENDTVALKYADSLLILVNAEADPAINQPEIALANMAEGDVLFALKKYNEAYDYYYQGKIAAEKSLDPYTLSEYSYRLGMVMYRKENFDIAAHYFVKAFEESGHQKDSFSVFFRRQEILNNAALSYLNCRQADSALLYADKGLQYVARNEPLYPGQADLVASAYGVLYGTKARVYLQQHNMAGEALLQKSIAINLQPHHEIGDGLLRQIDLAGFYLDTSSLRLVNAAEVLKIAKNRLDTLSNSEAAVKWNLLMSRYYYLTHQNDQAYTYLMRYNALHEVEIAESKALNETDLSNHLKVMQDRYEMNLLKANNQLKTTYLQIAIVLCALTGIILFLIFYSWKKKKKNIYALTLLNEQIQEQKLQLEETLQQLDKQNKEKDYILRVVAHDLRNPLSAISTLTRIIGEEYENEAENKEYLELMQSACKDSLNMIDSILQLSVQNKTNALTKQVLNVNKLAINCVELLRFKAEEKNQNLILHLADTPQYTFADSEKIGRIINNLVTNAIKFSHPNADIDVYVNDKETHVEIIIQDEGIGIPEHLKDKVFDVFTEAKRKGTSQEGTFGLGLSICKQLIEAHNGKIWFESVENEGTAFHILLQKEMEKLPLPEYETEKA